ncbi:MAG TPA: carboxypeptidase regulatory-like domain-containing protein [Candidatus Polarisedimenticolaceae bacterium]|nr:carboxypeptidase regulatory-like domain-containing protein [Candidatus Polarisedimenticolaceae bacterium]
MGVLRRLVLFAVLCLPAWPALAAGVVVSGVVVDQDGPVIGALVQLQGEGVPPKAAMTGADGRYTFKDVTAGKYTLQASFAGGEPVAAPPIMVTDGKAVDVPPLSLVVQTVEVTAKVDEVEVQGNTTTGETFQSKKLEYIPTARSYTDVLKIAPGVTEDTGGNSNGGPSGISVYGSSSLESSYIIDGVNTTSIDTGRPSTNINYDMIDKIEIKTGGYNAEFGGAQGAVVNVSTKTGTNLFAGSFNIYLSPDQLSSQPKQNDLGTQLPTPDGREVSGTLGGPIVKDKLWFFAAIADRTIRGVAPQEYLNLLDTPGQPATSRQFAEDTDRSAMYSLKTTWQVTANNRLTANYFSDPRVANYRDELGGYGGDYELTTGGTTAALDFTSVLGKRWVFDASAGLHTENADTLPTLDRRESNPIGENRRLSYQSIRVKIASTDPETGSSGGANDVSLKVGPYAYSGDTSGDRQFIKASIEGSYLKHTPKFGVEFEPSSFDQDLKYGWGTGISLEWADATQPNALQQEQQVGIRRCWGDGHGACLDWNHQIHAQASTDSMRAFVQDQWKPTADLTVNYGLRWESQSVKDSDGNVLVKMDKNFAPRLGFTWDVLGGGRSKLYMSAGRYYDTVPLQVMSRAFAPRQTMTRLYRTRNWSYLDFINSFNVGPEQTGYGLCATNTPGDDYNTPTCWDFESYDLITNPYQTTGFVDKVYSPNGLLNSGNPRGLFVPDVIVTSGSLYRSPIVNDLKGSSTDEVMAGFDWTFKQSWTAGVRIIGRKLNDAIEDISLDLGRTFIIANPGGPYHFYIDPNNPDMYNPNYDPTSTDYSARAGLGQMYGCSAGTICTVTPQEMKSMGLGAVPSAQRTFRGLEFTLAKQLTDKFWFNFSYLHSKTVGNYRGRYFVETEERDPNQTEAFDVPALAVNTYGRLPQDRPEQVKMYGSYRVSEDITLSGTLRYSSGTPLDATTDPLGGSTPFLGPIYLMPRGSAGRTPGLTNFDMGFAYDIRDSARLKLTLTMDVFNVLNEQNAVKVDSQFLAAGMWKGAFYDPNLGFFFQQEGRGEPFDGYIDGKFGNGDGIVTPDEWNRWAGSFEGRFHSLQALYTFLRTETVPVLIDGVVRDVPAYPGFSNCPAQLPSDYSLCGGLNARFGQSTQLEAPRSIRLGVRLAF